MRQLLADKVSGTHVGLWLLIPEHLRLGTWPLLLGWSGAPAPSLEPRLALQLVGEAALCVRGRRQSRSLSQKGFELAHGLPFVASDQAIHDLLDAHTVAQAQQLQRALGMVRRASGHFAGAVLAVDPHRMRSYSKRQMRRRKDKDGGAAVKTAQVFFCLDADTGQPVAFTAGSSARSAPQAAPELLELARDILGPAATPLVLMDSEHYSAELFEHVAGQTPFDLLVPLPHQPALDRAIARIDPACFTSRWAGFATTTKPYRFTHGQRPFYQLIQRCGETPGDYHYKAFLSTRAGAEVEDLTVQFPKRWHIEEFFNANQALGWNRAGTLNLNVRQGQMTMALLAQAAIHQLRGRLGAPWQNWDAAHLARELLAGLDGDVRVQGDTVVVTYYNAPGAECLRQSCEGLPQILEREGIDPRIPWLYDFKLDFRFK